MAMLTKPLYPSYNQFIISLKAHDQVLQLEAETNGHQTNHEQAYYGRCEKGQGHGGRFNSRGRDFVPEASQSQYGHKAQYGENQPVNPPH